MRIVLTLLAVLALLGACRVRGPVYARPALDMPGTHRDEVAAGPLSAADRAWWDVFQDPALQRLVREAIANNQDLDLAAARVEESRALIGLARSEGRPQLDVDASVSRQRASAALTGGGAADRLTNDIRAALGASWELDLWGRVRRSTEAAWADYLGSEEGRRAVLVALIGDVAQAYVELLALDWQLAITRETVEVRRRTRDLFQRRLEGEIGSELEVARAAGDLAGVEADVPLFVALVAQKENQLSLLLGRLPGPIERGAPLDETRSAPDVPAGLPSTLLERRPDVRAAEDALRAAVARVGVARAEFFPRVSLTGALGLESGELSSLGTADGVFWSLGAGLVAPLFSGGRLEANEQAAWARAKQAEATWKLAAQGAFRDVADALAALRASREITASLAAQVKARRRSLELGTQRFEGQLASYFEVLDAQRELFPAQLKLAGAKRDELLAVVRLYRALGGGWNADEGAAPCARPEAVGSAPAASLAPAAGPVAPIAAPPAGALPAQPAIPAAR